MEELSAKSIFRPKLNMRFLGRVALKFNSDTTVQTLTWKQVLDPALLSPSVSTSTISWPFILFYLSLNAKKI